MAILFTHTVCPFSHSKINANHLSQNIESTRYGDGKDETKDKKREDTKPDQEPEVSSVTPGFLPQTGEY